MNKTALMNYALSARKELESQIALSLNKLGIYKNSIKKANIVGDYTIIEGTEETFPKRVYELRTPILTQVKENGFDQVVEEFAYTWFNRIIALRFMEVHDYFDHGFRVLSSRDGSYEPEVLKSVSYVIDYLKLDRNVVTSLHDQGKTEELYRYILFKQCNALSNTLPMLFDAQEAYMELLLPNNLLSKGSVIRQIEDIPEEDFLNDIEVIGWLYQFYNSVKKDQVFASKETITKDTLPAVTQLFTPDWIVRYMAQNSIGRIWLESYPDSPLKSQMKYYVEDAKQEEEVQKKLDAIKYKNVNPEDLRIIEPCCGSGHILVYVFDLLLEMYKERGYNVKDIPGKILSKNLFGLDVDKRASQLSQFSLMMKARSIDNRFFSDNRRVIPQVYEIQDSKLLISLDYKKNIIDFGFSKKTRDIVDYLVETFEDGKVIGSLLKVEPKNYQSVINEVESVKNTYVVSLLQMEFANYGLKRIEEICSLAKVLSDKYDVLVTNPPYLRSSRCDELAIKYFTRNFRNSMYDMFAMFMDTNLVKNNGFTSMINQQSWMYLIHFETLRYKLLTNMAFINILHLGSNTFEHISGEVVQSCSFVFRKNKVDNSTFKLINLRNSPNADSKHDDFINGNYQSYNIIQQELLKKKQYIFEYEPALFDESYVEGIIENDGVYRGPSFVNNSVLRQWYEVKYNNICSNYKDSKKWIFCSRNGNKNRWFSFKEEIIEKKLLLSASNYETQNKYGVLWNDSRFGNPTTIAKIKDENESYESALNLITCDADTSYMYLALFNLGYYEEMLKSRINGQHFSPVYIKKLEKFINNSLVSENVIKILSLHEEFQKVIEISPNFQKPFEMTNNLLKDNYQVAQNDIENTIGSIKNCELIISNEINKFIYSKSDSKNKLLINPISKEEYIKSIISYFIGCIMGRYSLEHEGLIYAQEKGIGFDPSMYGDYVDEDGILPVYNFAFMEDGLTEKICQMVKRVYGEDTDKENMEFIVSALEPDSNDSPEQILNRYLNNEFYNNHLKIYQKMPIYWMFSSGKHGAFKCLVYMHRYNKDTIARINAKYFLPRTAMYKSEHSRLEGLLETISDARQNKYYQKQLDEVIACEKELLEYGQVLDHMANQFIDLDLDDGVKVNYEKLQNVELIVDGATIKKNLLVPIK